MEDKFINSIKSHYKEPDLDIDIDAIWENVDNRLPKKDEKKGFFWYWFGGIVGIALLGFIMFLCLNKTFILQNATRQSMVGETNSKNENSDIKPIVKSTDEVVLKNDLLRKNSQELNFRAKNIEIQTNSINAHINPETSNSQKRNESQLNSNKTLQTNVFFRDNQIGDEYAKANEVSLSQGAEATLIHENKSVFSNVEKKKNEIDAFDKIASLKFNLFNFKNRINRKAIFTKIINKKKDYSHQNMLYFGTHVDVSLTNENISAKSNNDDQFVAHQIEARTSLESINTGLILGYNLNQNIGIQTGINFNQINTRFDYSGTYYESVTRTVIDTIIYTGPNENDFLTSESDETVFKTINRQTRSYNKYKSKQIPLLLTLRSSNSNMNYKLTVGPQFNFSSKTKGMNLNRDNRT